MIPEVRGTTWFFSSPLKKLGCDRLMKNDEMQGAQILRNEAYMEYFAVTKDEVTPLA